MIIPKYQVKQSLINNAGKGLFLTEPIKKASIIIAPDKIDKIMHEQELAKFAKDSIENESSVRWFEDYFTISPDWPDECFVNHSFTPNSLWHLGFIFAVSDLEAGTEITCDYRYLIGTNEKMDFKDSATGKDIIGVSWQENILFTAQKLIEILK
jgi:hypothetical protein